MKSSPLTSKGQVTVPKEIRELLKVKTGDLIDFVVDPDGRVVIRAGRVRAGELKGLLHRPGGEAREPRRDGPSDPPRARESSMIGLDTNVLVRYLTQDDPEQSAEANSVIEGTARKGERCYLSSDVLCELVWVLRGAYRYDKRTILTVVEKLLSTVELSVEDKDSAYRALDGYRDGGGDFADHLIGWRNHRAGCDNTVTFDRSLEGSGRFKVL